MIESLDYRSLLFMTALLAYALSAQLLAIQARIATLKGLKAWVCANFFIGSAILIFISNTIPLAIISLLGGLLMVFGLSSYFIALCNFSDDHNAKRVLKKTLVMIALSNLALFFLGNSNFYLVIFNTAICVLLSLMSAILLLKPQLHIKRPIEQFITGVLFVVFASLTAWRLFILTQDKIDPVGHLTLWAYNEITFLACMLSVLAINFAFTAMVNVKIAEELTHAAGHDWLTGVMNRRRFEESFNTVLASSVRHGHAQSMMLLDLDNFKNINDQYGHLFGDKVIKTFANLAKENVRGDDILGRYGGEEFCIVMPNTTEAAAIILAERIRARYESTFIWLGSKRISCTVSIGVCDSTQVGNDFKSLFEAADQCLYAAKKSGKNLVIAHSNKKGA